MPIVFEGGINIPAVSQKIDKIRSAYDMTYRVVLLSRRLLLIADIPIATMAMAGGYIPFIPDPVWSREVALTCMFYMAVLLAALAIRMSAHIRMIVFDRYLPSELVRSLDIVADLAVLALTVIMIMVGWKHATGIGAKDTYMSIPRVSRFWIYFPVSLTGVAILVLEVEALYNHVKSSFVKEGMEQWVQVA